MIKQRQVLVNVTLILALLAWSLASFIRFATREPQLPLQPADGIVVLTGARDRIPDAVRLLVEGKGKRLLISGVHDKTSLADLVRIDPALHDLIPCCVDLDRKARNTVGNALESTQWAHDHGYHSLIIVTSHYHMPRALQEFAAAAPDLTLIAFPVVSNTADRPHWWSDPATIRLFIGEWIKYHGSRLRLIVGWSGLAQEGGPDVLHDG